MSQHRAAGPTKMFGTPVEMVRGLNTLDVATLAAIALVVVAAVCTEVLIAVGALPREAFLVVMGACAVAGFGMQIASVVFGAQIVGFLERRGAAAVAS